MFENKHYVSKKVPKAIPIEIQNIIWEMIWDLGKRIKLDSQQFFELTTLTNNPYAQIIEHCQTYPAYWHKRYFLFNHPVTYGIEVIDYGEYSLMVLAHEH